MKEKILIIGGGRLGHAIMHALRQAGQPVETWDVKAERCSSEQPFEKLAHEASIFFIAAPTKANRVIARKLTSFLNKRDIVVSFAKGLEAPRAVTPVAILAEEIGASAVYGFLTGPMLAAEIEGDQPTFAELSLSRESAFRRVALPFNKTCIDLAPSRDLTGLMLCSVFKNCYAVGLGMFDALGYGTNLKSALTVQILKEVERLLPSLGGRKYTVWGQAGLGDMLTTGWGTLSYNYHTGQRIVEEKDTTLTSEGCQSLRQMKRFLKGKTTISEFPILKTLERIVAHGKDPRTEFQKLWKVRP